MTAALEEGCIDDVILNQELIRDAIPSKADIDEAEIRTHLEGTPHGVILSKAAEELLGLTVWYEREGDLYLWLGAYKVRGNGLGSDALNHIERTTDYKRWFAKVGQDNDRALRILQKHGFQRAKVEGSIVYLERRRR